MLIPLWELVLYKFNTEDHNCEEAEKEVINSRLLGLPRFLNICKMLEIEVVVFISTLIVGKWMMPIKMRMSRLLLSQIVFQYVANGSDIVELFSNLDEEAIEFSYSLMIAILGNVFYRFLHALETFFAI